MLLENHFESENDLLGNNDRDLWYQERAIILMNNGLEVAERDKAKTYIVSFS